MYSKYLQQCTATIEAQVWNHNLMNASYWLRSRNIKQCTATIVAMHSYYCGNAQVLLKHNYGTITRYQQAIG